MNVKRIILFVLLVSVLAVGVVFGQQTSFRNSEHRIEAAITDPRNGEVTIVNNSNEIKSVTIAYVVTISFMTGQGRLGGGTVRSTNSRRHVTLNVAPGRRSFRIVEGQGSLTEIREVLTSNY